MLRPVPISMRGGRPGRRVWEGRCCCDQATTHAERALEGIRRRDVCYNRYAFSRSAHHAAGFARGCCGVPGRADHEAGDPAEACAQRARCGSTLVARIIVRMSVELREFEGRAVCLLGLEDHAHATVLRTLWLGCLSSIPAPPPPPSSFSAVWSSAADTPDASETQLDSAATASGTTSCRARGTVKVVNHPLATANVAAFRRVQHHTCLPRSRRSQHNLSPPFWAAGQYEAPRQGLLGRAISMASWEPSPRDLVHVCATAWCHVKRMGLIGDGQRGTFTASRSRQRRARACHRHR